MRLNTSCEQSVQADSRKVLVFDGDWFLSSFVFLAVPRFNWLLCVDNLHARKITAGKSLKCTSPLISLHLNSRCLTSRSASINPKRSRVFRIFCRAIAAFSQSCSVIGDNEEFDCTTRNSSLKSWFTLIAHRRISATVQSHVIKLFSEFIKSLRNSWAFGLPRKYSIHAYASTMYLVTRYPRARIVLLQMEVCPSQCQTRQSFFSQGFQHRFYRPFVISIREPSPQEE